MKKKRLLEGQVIDLIKFNLNRDNPTFNLRIEIENAVTFRRAIAKQNEPNIFRAKCKGNYPFEVFVNRSTGDDPLIVKILKNAHKCYRVFKNRKVNSVYLLTISKRGSAEDLI